MGFYGNKNITANSSKSAFVFDRTYANRRDMDKAADTDGVYIGRFVLVDYGIDGSMNEILYTPVFIKPNTNPQEFYTSAEFEEDTRIIEGDNRQGVAIKEGDIVYTKEYTSEPAADELENMVKVFYICTGSDENGYATFNYVTMETKNKYTQNYNIDLSAYTDNNGGRGFDSTVWQKVYISSDSTLGAKYVQVAELNSVVPTFNLTYDAPTLYPNTPHFDTNSTNLYYNLHVQPSWGLKVMAANAQHKQGVDAPHKSTNGVNYPSDIQMGYYRKYVDEEGKEQQAFEFYPGAIYYNKAGFDSKKIAYATTVADELSITPTGISKNKYNIHGQAQQEERVDTHEIKVMLPSIGNTIAHVWDLVYGNEAVNGNVERNQDIQWNSTKGLRLVEKLNETYSMNPNKVETIAGCINSIHDLMGMIIETDVPEDAKNAESNKIYFKDGLFYIKGKYYKYTPIESPENPDGTENNFVAYEPIDLEDFSTGQYFQKKINYEIDSTEHELNANFITSTGQYIEGADYYTVEINEDNVQFENDYEPGSYFYYEGEERPYEEVELWLRDYSEQPRKNIKYYTVKPEPIQSAKSGWYIFNPALFTDKDSDSKFFEKKVDEDGNVLKYELLTENSVYPSDATEPPQYYKIKVDELVDITYVDEAGNLVPGYAIPPEIQENIEEYSVRLIRFNPTWTYYTITEYDDLQLVDIQKIEDIDISTSYYRINRIDPCGNFYFPYTYYYKEWVDREQGKCNYILSTENTYSALKEYVDLTPTLVLNKFYEPNKYYYEISEKVFVLDLSAVMQENTQYYIHNDIYVKDDDLGLMPPGTIWNQDVNNIPDSIELATREEYYDWKELPGFARELNTVHGLILRINQMLLDGDSNTRDSKTVQGSINKLNDIIYKISSLIPQQLVVVDSYGKIHSATQDSNQYYITTDCKNNYPQANAQGDLKQLLDSKKEELIKTKTPTQMEEETEEEFLARLEEYEQYLLDLNAEIAELEELTFKPIVQVDVTADPASPKVKVLHKFYPEEGEQISIDFNDTEETSFTVHSPIVDNYGHTVGHNYLDIVMPNEYQTITTSNSGAAETSFNDNPAQDKVEFVADSITDTLNFDSGNKWISFDSDNTSKTVTIYHNKANTDTLTDTVGTIQTPSFGSSFNIPTLSFDAAGHLSSIGTKTVSLPGLSAKVEGEAQKDVITGITPSSSGVLTFATEDVDQFTLKNYGTAGSFINSNLTITGAFKAIDTELKSLGDRTTSLEDTYLTKTNAANTYLTQTNAANTYLTPDVADNKYLAASKESSFVLLATYEAKIAELERKITELTNKVNAAHPAEQQ